MRRSRCGAGGYVIGKLVGKEFPCELWGHPENAGQIRKWHEARAVSSGWARQATNKNTNSNAPTTIAILSTTRYEPLYAITISAMTISAIVTGVGTPIS